MHWDEERYRWTRAKERVPVKVPLSQERQEIIRLLVESDIDLTPKAIAQKLDRQENAIRKMLRFMVADNQIVQPARGLYTSVSTHLEA
jgi:hypothetical protein